MKMNDFINSFNLDRVKKSQYIGVLIDIDGVVEVIINSNKNFSDKLSYYVKAYDSKLVHKRNKNIKIIGYTFRDSFEDIYYDFEHEFDNDIDNIKGDISE